MFFLKKLYHFITRKLHFFIILLITSPRRFLFTINALGVKKKGKPTLYQPGLLLGKGQLIFGKQVRLGYPHSPGFYSTYAYLEARGPQSKIIFHNYIWCNNNLSIIADNTTITISDHCFIGANVEILDSNFHQLDPDKRHQGTDPDPQSVFIAKNVYIGNGVKILKGVSIGENTVIGNGAVVVQSIPDNVIALGNPCRVFGKLQSNKEILYASQAL